MVAYRCSRCGFSSDRKDIMDQHIKRKKLCAPTIADVNPMYNVPNPCHCDRCNRVFTSVAYRDRHQVNCVPNGVITQITLHGDVVNINDGGTQVNVFMSNGTKVNDFGNESTDHVTETTARSCLNSRENGVIRMSSIIYMNPDVVANHNVQICDRSRNTCKVLENGRFVERGMRHTVSQMVQKSVDTITTLVFPYVTNAVSIDDPNALTYMNNMNRIGEIPGTSNKRECAKVTDAIIANLKHARRDEREAIAGACNNT